VGVFYKGWFYDMREDIQRYFSELGRVLREHADRIAPVLGTASSKLFADGINMVQGRYWRTYIPGKPAFDAEAATLAGAWGITFATIEDARPLVDTPLDTFENCNIANIALQTRTLACLFYHILNDTNERGTPGPASPSMNRRSGRDYACRAASDACTAMSTCLTRTKASCPTRRLMAPSLSCATG
jgi:hypothetical protein